MVRLAGRLGIGTPWTRIAAGLGLRRLTRRADPDRRPVLGVPARPRCCPGSCSRWSAWPGGGRPARRSPRPGPPPPSALCGGINARRDHRGAAARGHLPADPAPGPAPRWRILAWWCPAVVAATWWWSVPLVLLSRYGVSIIPYTESAAVTTSVTGLSEILRGDRELGQLPGGERAAVVAAGLPDRHRRGADPADRRWPRASAWPGCCAPAARPAGSCSACCSPAWSSSAAGHVSSLGNPLAGPVDQLINGPAAAVPQPAQVRSADPAAGRARPRPPAGLGPAAAAAGARWPAAAAGHRRPGAARLHRRGSASPVPSRQIPPYWVSAADWLNRHAGHQAVLVVPGAAVRPVPLGQPAR